MEHYFSQPPHVMEKNQDRFARIRQEYLKEVFIDRENSVDSKGQRLRRDFERLLQDYISTGNIAAICTFLDEVNHNGLEFSAGAVSMYALQQARYVLVSCVAVGCRAAIDGGLPEHIAYTISDCYIRQLDKLDQASDIYALILGGLYEFGQAVHDHRFPACTPPVRVCLEYISNHLHTAITLEDLSAACGLSSNYVSDLFHKELSVRPMAYIREEKLKYAALLLRDTDAPAAQIAALLAFPSPSALSSQFQKQYGLSPSAYRKSHSD